MNREGIFYIIAAPSGTGKTSLVKALLKKVAEIKVSISYTTRPKRANEKDGIDYHFVSEDQFNQMVAEKQFLEHAEVFGYQYGTSHHWVLEQLAKGIDVILEIDWQGARQVCQQFSSALSIFILPPSKTVLKSRLNKRNQDSENVIEKRITAVQGEVIHFHEFDYLIINDNFDCALQDLIHVIEANRLKCAYQASRHAKLLAEFLETQ